MYLSRARRIPYENVHIRGYFYPFDTNAKDRIKHPLAMTSSNGPEYDLSLLAMAPSPAPSRGIPPGPLEYKPQTTPPPRREDLESGQPKLLPYTPNTTVGDLEKPQLVSTTSIPIKPSPSIAFYRTAKGIIILVIITTVILAAIIGGVVGAIVVNKKSVASQQILTSTRDSPSQDGPATPRITLPYATTPTLSRMPVYPTPVYTPVYPTPIYTPVYATDLIGAGI